MGAAEVHAATLTLDTHVDIRWPEPPDPLAEGPMRVDFPKMARGGLRAAVFVAYVPQGRRDEAGHAAAAERAEAMLRHIRAPAASARRRMSWRPATRRARSACSRPSRTATPWGRTCRRRRGGGRSARAT